MQNTNAKNDLAQLAKGVHSLCQNKNAHSLGLKSHLKRLQFHTMFDVCMTVSWIECLFLHKPSTPARDTSFQQIQFILFILMIELRQGADIVANINSGSNRVLNWSFLTLVKKYYLS